MVLTPTLSRRALAALVALTPLRTPADTFGSVAGYAPRIEGLGGGADVLLDSRLIASRIDFSTSLTAELVESSRPRSFLLPARVEPVLCGTGVTILV